MHRHTLSPTVQGTVYKSVIHYPLSLHHIKISEVSLASWELYHLEDLSSDSIISNHAPC